MSDRRTLSATEKRLLKNLKTKIVSLKGDIQEQQLFQELNPDDHPVSSKPGKKEIKKSIAAEKEARQKLKNAKSLISRIKAGALSSSAGRGGGGGSLMKQIGGGAAVGRKAIKKLMDEL